MDLSQKYNELKEKAAKVSERVVRVKVEIENNAKRIQEIEKELAEQGITGDPSQFLAETTAKLNAAIEKTLKDINELEEVLK